MAEADLSKVVFSPSKSVTFTPINKKQQVVLDITNNSTTGVMVKFKNTNPTLFKTHPINITVKVGQKLSFKCVFKGGTKEELGKKMDNQRFTVVLISASQNANKDKVLQSAYKAATLKHKIAILFAGYNDQKEKETQQPTNNEEEDEKDRQGQMRTKSKIETAKPNMPTLHLFTRKDMDSVSEEDEEGGGTTPIGDAPPSDDMMTTRPAGAFTGQIASNEAAGNPKSELRTTRPAGAFTGQVASNAPVPGAPVDPKSDYRTTRPAGAFTGQVASNEAAGPTTPKSELKTTRPAGAYTGQVASNPGGAVDPKSGLRTTRAAGEYNGQVTPNAGNAATENLKTTKQAGSFENPQRSNK